LSPSFSLGTGREGENDYLALAFKIQSTVGDFTAICSPVENSWRKLSLDVVVILRLLILSLEGLKLLQTFTGKLY